MKISRATLNDLEKIAPLFNDYRIFYKQGSDLKAATAFLKERLSNNESIIFYAEKDNAVYGFIQLFYSFSSVTLQPSLILNDLYVQAQHRGKGIGEALLNKSKEFCKANNYKGLALETAIDNPAQKLYEKLGWKKDIHCLHYFWTAK